MRLSDQRSHGEVGTAAITEWLHFMRKWQSLKMRKRHMRGNVCIVIVGIVLSFLIYWYTHLQVHRTECVFRDDMIGSLLITCYMPILYFINLIILMGGDWNSLLALTGIELVDCSHDRNKNLFTHKKKRYLSAELYRKF